MVIDHGVHILISDLLTGISPRPAQDTPSASIRYFAQFFDVHVYQFTWAVFHVADRCAGGAVQVGEAGQSPAGEHPVDGRTRYASRPAIRWGPSFSVIRSETIAFPSPKRPDRDCGEAARNDPPVRPLPPLGNVSSTDRRSAETLPPIQRLGLPANPTRRSDPPTTYARTVSTFYSWFSRGPPFDSRNVAYPTNQTRRPSLIQAFCQPRPWEGHLVTHEGVHLAIPDHSAKFWLTVQSLCPETEKAKQWLSTHYSQLTVDLALIATTPPK